MSSRITNFLLINNFYLTCSFLKNKSFRMVLDTQSVAASAETEAGFSSFSVESISVFVEYVLYNRQKLRTTQNSILSVRIKIIRSNRRKRRQPEKGKNTF
jgi:hypothetical protein